MLCSALWPVWLCAVLCSCTAALLQPYHAQPYTALSSTANDFAAALQAALPPRRTHHSAPQYSALNGQQSRLAATTHTWFAPVGTVSSAQPTTTATSSSSSTTTSGGGGGGWYRASVIGVGSAVPPTVISNFDIEKIVNTSDAWISQRTGISRRRVLLAEESLQDLSATAARRALAQARVDPSEVDAVIVATSSPEDLFGDATSIAARIGAYRAVGWDMRAACSGFVFAMIDAAQYIETRTLRTVVVVGADALSRWVDWSDRNICILFGDGAGAVVMRAVEDRRESGLLAFTMGSDPQGHDHLHLQRTACTATAATTDGATAAAAAVLNAPQRQQTPREWQPMQKPEVNTIQMNGREVYRFVLTVIGPAISEMLQTAGLELDGVDWFILHQANSRILDAVADQLKVPRSKMLCNIQDYGNTSAASIPLALDEFVAGGVVQRGQVVVSVGFGGGLSWGGVVLRWGGPSSAPSAAH